MKWLGLFLILAGCSGIGIASVNDYDRRILALGKLKQMVLYIRDEVAKHHASLPEAIRHSAGRLEGEYAQFLNKVSEKLENFCGEEIGLIWKSEASRVRAGLSKKDFEDFSKCMDQTGFLDAASQEQALSDYEKQLGSLLEELKKSREDTCRLHFSVGILSGFFLCILLL